MGISSGIMLDLFCFLNFTFYICKTVSEKLFSIDNLLKKIQNSQLFRKLYVSKIFPYNKIPD